MNTKVKKDHLKKEDRNNILLSLERRESLKDIAEEIGAHPSTISREIRKHIKINRNSRVVGKRINDCTHRTNCPMTIFHGECEANRRCPRSSCYNCSHICGPNKCNYYEKEICPSLLKAPYVCNGCKKKFGSSINFCTFEKRFYEPTLAQEEYEETLSSSRSGFRLKGEEKREFEETLKVAIKEKGQSPNHIFSTIRNYDPTYKTPVGLTTTYKMINEGAFDELCRLDLDEAVKRKKRRDYSKTANTKQEKKPRNIYVGRSYLDYIPFIADNDLNVVQMDTVEGIKGGKVLLTLFFSNTQLQLYYVLESKSNSEVTRVFRVLRATLGLELFRALFPAILTDRGCEFTKPDEIEFDNEGNRLTNVFFCDPQRSDQKGAAERNHRELRKILPKGTAILFDQEKAFLVASSLAAMPRPKLNNKTPYEVFSALYGEDVLRKLGLFYISPKDVILKPSLLLD